MTETDYLAKAREQIALEDAAAAEGRVQGRAAAMREADERARRHRDLAIEHGLPADATPRQIADAMLARESEFWSGFIGTVGAGWPARYATLCAELGLDETKVEKGEVWQKMRETGHKLCRAVRDPNTGGFATPSDPRIEKLQALADRPGTAGEGVAAQAAIGRITGNAA